MIVFIIQLAHLLLLWFLEFYPYPELIVYPYLRTIGLLPYKQILDQHFPGLMFFPVNLNTLGFTDPYSLKILLLLIVLGQSVLIYKISKSWLAVLLYALWQPFLEGNQLWLDLFLPLFTLAAWHFWQKQRWFLAGLLLGLGVVFKQTLIPLVVFAGVYLVWRYRSKCLSFLLKFGLAALSPSILMLWHFWRLNILSDFWYWTVTFNLSDFARMGRLWPTVGQTLKLVWPATILWLAAAAVPSSRLMIGWLVFSVVGGMTRFGFVHLQPAVPYFAILYASLLVRMAQKSRRLAVMMFIPSLVFAMFSALGSRWQATRFYQSQDIAVAKAISKIAGIGESAFLLGVNPHLYQLTQTIPSGRILVFQFPWFLQVSGQRILEDLKTDPPKVVAYDSASHIDGQYLKDYAAYLVEYVQKNYRAVTTLGTVTIYESSN